MGRNYIISPTSIFNKWKILLCGICLLSGTLVVAVSPAGNSNAISLTPNTISLEVLPGQLVLKNITVANNTENVQVVSAAVDTNWMFLYPAEFELYPNDSKVIVAGFLLPQEPGELSGLPRSIQFETDIQEVYEVAINLMRPKTTPTPAPQQPGPMPGQQIYSTNKPPADTTGVLHITPPVVFSDLSSNRLLIHKIELTNTQKKPLQMNAEYDTSWVVVHPENFTLESGITEEIIVSLIPTALDLDNPHQSRVVRFHSQNDTVSGLVRIRVANHQPPPQYVSKPLAVSAAETPPEKSERQEPPKSVPVNPVLPASQMGNSDSILSGSASRPGPEISDDSLLTGLYEYSQEYLESELRAADIELTRDEESVMYTVSGIHAFEASSVYLKIRGYELLTRVGQILTRWADPRMNVFVVGHADSIPVARPIQSTMNAVNNWELSALRSATVVNYFENSLNLPGQYFHVIGHSHYRPITDNTTEEGRMRNRRLELIVTYHEDGLLY